MKKQAIIACLWGMATCVYAQSLHVETLQPTSTSGKDVVRVDDTWHAVDNANVTFTLNFTPPQLDVNTQRNLSIKRVTCLFNGETKELESGDGNTYQFNYSVSSVREYAPAQLTLEYTFEEFKGYEQKEEIRPIMDGEGVPTGENDTIMVDDETKPIWTEIPEAVLMSEVCSEKIQIWETPSVVISSTEPDYRTETRTISIDAKGGGEWEYYLNGVKVEATFVIEKPQSLPGWTESMISIINKAPNGTYWYNNDNNPTSISTYFYDVLDVKGEVSVNKTNFYKTTDEAEWTLVIQGGGSKNEIVWTGGESDLTTNSQREPYHPFVTEVTSTITNRLIHATVVTKADDDHVLDTQSYTFDAINVFPRVELEQGRSSMSIYEGEEISFMPTVSGEPTYWFYTWSNGSASQEMTDNPTKTTIYTLHAEYKFEEDVLNFIDVSYTAEVFPKPSLNVKDELSISSADGSQIYTPTLENIIEYPQTSSVGQDYHLILGNDVEINPVPTGGVPNGWTYKVYNGDTEITGTKFKPTSTGTYNIRVEFSNGEGIVETPYYGTTSRRYVVYNKPQLIEATTEIHMLSGQSEAVKAIATGGEESGWTFTWNNGETGTDFSFDAGDVTSKTVFEHTLTAENVCEGLKQFSETRTYKFVVWPQPKISNLSIKLRDKEINKIKNIVYFDKETDEGNTISIECYDGDILDIAYAVEGGYTGDENCWTYQNSKSDVVPLSYTIDTANKISETDNVVASSDNQSYSEETFHLSFNNGPDRSKVYSSNYTWLNEQYTVKVKAWHLPSIQESYTDSVSTTKWKEKRVDVYAGGMPQNNVNLVVNNQYGNTENGGWTYSWTEDGTEISDNASQWTYVPSTEERYYSDKVLGLHITNKIGDNYALDETFEYPIRVWHKVVFASQFSMTDNNRNGAAVTKGIREGNVFTDKVEEIDYGYFPENGTSYVYDWRLENPSDVKDSDIEFHSDVLFISTDKKMEADDITDRLVLFNYGPYGRVWDQRALEHSYRIYHKPATPENIVKKGNFATGTLAVSMPSTMSDTELNTYDYNLVFGYVDTNGEDVDFNEVVEQAGAGTVRWYQVPASERSHENYYVYAVWAYTDGARITSGKRYMMEKNGTDVDEEWDGSTYGNVDLQTRAFVVGSDAATDIQAVSTEMHKYGEDNAPLIYTLDGQLVRNPQSLKPGIYLFESTSNGKKTTKKIFVK